MKLEIRKANRLDFERLLAFCYDEMPVIDYRKRDLFDQILCQTGYTLLLAEADGVLSGVLGVSIIEGVGDKYPLAVLSGGKLCSSEKAKEIGDALTIKATQLAQRAGCLRIIS